MASAKIRLWPIHIQLLDKKANLQLGWLSSGFKRSIALVVFFALWEILPRIGVVNTAFYRL